MDHRYQPLSRRHSGESNSQPLTPQPDAETSELVSNSITQGGSRTKYGKRKPCSYFCWLLVACNHLCRHNCTPSASFSLTLFLLDPPMKIGARSLVAQWLNCCPGAKTVLTTWASIPGSQLKVDSAFHPSGVGRMITQLACRGWGGCVACIINL